MLDRLTTEGRNPESEAIDDMSALEIVDLMNREDAGVATAVASQCESIAAAIDLIAERFRRGGRLIYIGAGTSGRLAVLDASECPPTFSSPPQQVVGIIAGGTAALTTAVEGAEDRADLAAADLEKVNLGPLDALVGIATSGRTPYVVEALRIARQRGAATIGLTCNADSKISELVDISIAPVVGPEVLSGSTRLKAGTATKMVLNMLSTGAMVRIGKTYGNLLVDMQATNTKLRMRSQRIVQHLTDLDELAAGALLDRCNGQLKTAILVARLAIAPADARERLRNADGHLRRALEIDAKNRALLNYENLLLGVDAGGTSTEAVLGRWEDGKLTILGRGTAGPANPQAVGFAAAARQIRRAVVEAFRDAGMPTGKVRRACLAVAGAGRPNDQQRISKLAVEAQLAEQIRVVDDAVPLLAAAAPDGWGIVLIAGTGSLARGRTKDGQTARAGGWGYLLGDEGSGYSLGLAALSTVTKSLDGRGTKSRLVEPCLQTLQASSAEEIIRRVYGQRISREEIAALATCVIQAAEQGDSVALQLLRKASEELALMIQAVATSLEFGSQSIPLALAGGLITNCRMLQGLLLESCRSQGLSLDPISIVQHPAEEALKLAARS